MLYTRAGMVTRFPLFGFVGEPGGSGTKLTGEQPLLDLIVPKAKIRIVQISAQPR